MWDGGYRVPGFIGGGLLPNAMRGTQLKHVIHIADFWPTFASLAGLPPGDSGGPTPLDGVDQSRYIFGQVKESPRTETVLDHLMHCVPGPGFEPELQQCRAGQTPDFPAGHYPNHTAGALLQSEGGKLHKLIVGPAAQATWYGHWPTNGTCANGTSGCKLPSYNAFVACWPTPCLFELGSDESEHVDLSGVAAAQPTYQRMLSRFKALESSYHPPKTNPPTEGQGICDVISGNRGFLRPFLVNYGV